MELVQTLSGRKRLQVSRLKAVPTELGQIMELANCRVSESDTPAGGLADLPSRAELQGNRPLSRHAKAFLDRWRKKVQAFPAPLRNFLGPVRRDTFSKLGHKYTFLREAVDVLRSIARTGAAKLRQGDFLYPVGNFICTDEDGKIQFIKSTIVTVLEGVEAGRIRECPICQNIFWAGRTDQQCCSPRCRKIWHTRRWREKYLHSYKLQRGRRAEQLRYPDS